MPDYDLLQKMGIGPSQFRVLADHEIGAVVLEMRTMKDDTTVLRWCLAPEAVQVLIDALAKVRRKVVDHQGGERE